MFSPLKCIVVVTWMCVWYLCISRCIKTYWHYIEFEYVWTNITWLAFGLIFRYSNQGHNSKRHIHILICFWCMMHTCQVIYITYIIRWIAFTFSLRAIFPEDYLNEKKFNACCQKDLDNINNLPNLLFVSCQNFELSFWVNEK